MIDNDEKVKAINVQWFPGHMKKAEKLIEENLPIVDVVIELLDARIPKSSANPLLAEILKGKPRVIALNKADLADPQATRAWADFFRGKGIPVAVIDAQKGKGLKQLKATVESLAKKRTDKFVKAGGKPRAARCMILGIPNVGKSSLINRLAGSAKTRTENKPGVTRAKQWIHIGTHLELLDTPGILWPKFEDPEVGLKLAFTGAIKDDIYDVEQVACLLLEILRKDYPERLQERFKFKGDIPETGPELLEAVGRKRGCLLKGGIVDIEKAERIVMSEFRSGKLGLLTLDELSDDSFKAPEDEQG